MDSLNKILNNKKLNEPPELVNLREYIKLRYKDNNISTKLNKDNITIQVHSASLANIIRLNLNQIKTDLNIVKRIQIIII